MPESGAEDRGPARPLRALPAVLSVALAIFMAAAPQLRAAPPAASPASSARRSADRIKAAAGALLTAAEKTAVAATTKSASPSPQPAKAASTQGPTASKSSRSAAPAAGAGSTTARPAATLSGWLGDGTTFPQRALVLTVSSGRTLTASSIRVTENGVAVGGTTLRPLSHPAAGDLATMVVIDQSASMAGAPLAAAMRAARSFARARTAQQEIGLITFDSVPSVFLHPTGDRGSISTVLSATPWTGKGANVPAAVAVALKELARARVALGAVIVISDGRGSLTTGRGPTPASVEKAAAAGHVPIFTVGLHDGSGPASLMALRHASPGEFVASSLVGLPSVLHRISATLDRGYVLRYRSLQAGGRNVTVDVIATGFSGSATVRYKTPAAPPHPAPARRRPSARTPPSVSQFAGSTLLSPSASFAPHAGPSRPTSFWASSQALPIIATVAAVLFTVAIALLFYRPSRRSVRVRVGSYIPDSELAGPEMAIDLGSSRSGAPRFLERGTWWPPFVEDVEIARSPHTPIYLVKRAALIGAVAAVLLLLVTGSAVLAILPLLLWPFPLRALVRRRARKQRQLFADTLPGYLQDLASAMRVGRSFAGSLSAVAESADEPVRAELERAVTDESLGRSIDESLAAVGRRMQSGDIDQVALIASLGRRSGSNVAEALDRVADGARDRADLRREISALTAQAKMSSWVLTALPPLLFLGISVVSPRYAHPLLHTTAGIILLVIAALMVFGGWKVMKKITTIKA